MFDIEIGGVPVAFTNFLSDRRSSIVNDILQWIAQLEQRRRMYRGRLVFTAIEPTQPFVDTIKRLSSRPISLRDNHDLVPPCRTERERRTRECIRQLRHWRHIQPTITTRLATPSCSKFFQPGECTSANTLAIITAPKPEGLLTAMVAVGVPYSTIEQDALAVVPGNNHHVGSPLSQHLVKNLWGCAPHYKDPVAYELDRQQLFSTWIEATQGNNESARALEAGACLFDQAKENAVRLASQAHWVGEGILMVDAINQDRFHFDTLAQLLAEKEGCHIIAIRHEYGYIAERHYVQVSVRTTFRQREINLRELLRAGSSGPLSDELTAKPDMLEITDELWVDLVLPRLLQTLALSL